MKFWVPWAIDAAIAAIAGGSLWLKSNGKPGVGAVLAWVLATPGLLVGLFFLILMLGNPRWN